MSLTNVEELFFLYVSPPPPGELILQKFCHNVAKGKNKKSQSLEAIA